jgi:hypothetical protein
MELYQEKWLKNREEGYITLRESIFTAMVTENKRSLRVLSDGYIVGTDPITINQ